MLNADELKHGPGPRLAFLASLDAQSLAEIMVAFANTEGGIIVIGLDTTGQPVSSLVISHDEVQKLLESAENMFNPGIVIEEWDQLDIDSDDFFDDDSDPIEGYIVVPANDVIKSPASAPVSAPLETKVDDADDGVVLLKLSPVPSANPPEKPTSIGLDLPAMPSVTVSVPSDTTDKTTPTPDDKAGDTPTEAAVPADTGSDIPKDASAVPADTAGGVPTGDMPADAEAKGDVVSPDVPATAEKTGDAPSDKADTTVTASTDTAATPADTASDIPSDKAATTDTPVDTASGVPTEVTKVGDGSSDKASTDTVGDTPKDVIATPADTTGGVPAEAVKTGDGPSAKADTTDKASTDTTAKADSLSTGDAVPVVPAKDEPPAVVPASPKVKPTLPPLYGVKIPRSIELHALNDGRVLIRSGARNRPLGGQEILRLASAKGTGEFEAEVVPGASQADFSRRLIDEYLMKRAERSKRPFSGSIDDMLLEIGALTPDHLPTAAGILLFSEYPQKWLPQSSVIFARFIGTQPRGESGMAGYVRREEITGPLPRLIEGAWNLVWSEMAVSAVVSGLEREERAEYPQFAVREAIVNSICHRDYRLRGRRIELRMYSDRLEVISPGGLPGFITVENIKDEHFSRNPRIVNGLFQWGYIEELGLGIDRMIEVMEQAGREPPHFDARPYSFAVTLNNEREKLRPLDWIRSANHRQARAMQYIREHGSITNREYRILCAGVSAETLRLDLAGMVDRGQLIKVGSKKGTHYILRDKDAKDDLS